MDPDPSDVHCVLTPLTDINPLGTLHTVTLRLTENGQPAEGIPIDFNVVAGPHAGDSAIGLTDALGETSFTYLGDGGRGYRHH